MKDMKVIAFLAVHFLQGSSLLLKQVMPQNEYPVCAGDELMYQCIANDTSISWYEDGFGVTLLKSHTDPRPGIRFEFRVVMSNQSSLMSTAILPKAQPLDEGTKIQCVAEGSTLSEIVKVAREPESCVCFVECCFRHGKLVVSLDVSFNLMCVERFLFGFDGQSQIGAEGQYSAMFEINTTGGMPFPSQTIHTLDYENRTGPHPCLYHILPPNAVKHIFHSLEANGPNIDLHIFIERPTFPIQSCLSPDDVTWSYNVSANTTCSSNSSHSLNSSRCSKVAEDKTVFPDVEAGETYEVVVIPTVVELNLSGEPNSTHIVITRTEGTESTSGSTASTSTKDTPTNSPTSAEADTSAVVGLSVAFVVTFILLCATVGLLVVLQFHNKYRNAKEKSIHVLSAHNRTGCVQQELKEIAGQTEAPGADL